MLAVAFETYVILQCDNLGCFFPSLIALFGCKCNRKQRYGDSLTMSGVTDCKLNESVNVLQIHLVAMSSVVVLFLYSKKPKPHRSE
jgi:hypothetical protein